MFAIIGWLMMAVCGAIATVLFFLIGHMIASDTGGFCYWPFGVLSLLCGIVDVMILFHAPINFF